MSLFKEFIMETGRKSMPSTNHFIGLHGQLHLVISELLAFTVRLLNLPKYGKLLLRRKRSSIRCILFSQRVYLSFKI